MSFKQLLIIISMLVLVVALCMARPHQVKSGQQVFKERLRYHLQTGTGDNVTVAITVKSPYIEQAINIANMDVLTMTEQAFGEVIHLSAECKNDFAGPDSICDFIQF